MKSLKKKVSLIYLILVMMIAVVGIVSVLNMYSLTRAIEGLIVDNYTSLKIISNMKESLERQDSAILIYANGNKDLGLRIFESSMEDFNKHYADESNNITEPGEKEMVEALKGKYRAYVDLFYQLKRADSQTSAIEFYFSMIVPKFQELKKDLNDIGDINERAMFRKKNKVAENAETGTFITFLFTAISVLVGYLISKVLVGKFTKPMEHLTETMRLVKAGDINKRIDVTSDDEIGVLAAEFNKMTERLQIFEKSTLGKVIIERNKSVAIVKSISDPLMVLDNTHKIAMINKAFEEFFCTSESLAYEKHFNDVIQKEELYEYISNIVFEETIKHKENIFYFEANEDHHYFNVIVTKIVDIDSDIKGLVVLFQDVTELKELEKMKTNFVSTVSHEFKTPLTSIMMGTSLLNDRTIGDLNNVQVDVVTSIEEDCQRLSNLVDDLLYISKIQSTKGIYDMKSTSILGVLEQAVKPFYVQAEGKGVRLYTLISQSLPDVMMDQEKIIWVINNLIVNALKYTSSGGEVEVLANTHEEKLYITVRDSGTGIPNEYVDKIFDQFVQVENSDLEVRGTGLGLFIAKEIVEAHGGKIWCESTLDVGSSFTFVLPLDLNAREKR